MGLSKPKFCSETGTYVHTVFNHGFYQTFDCDKGKLLLLACAVCITFIYHTQYSGYDIYD